ncbi:sigma-54-dependent transcriptional regulator [Dongia sp.]|uniref:sigma-54-dependent transcriptional regulator n=1 Tax=Dongia sp. TaxID=1977262 RepID=UPI0035AE9218
MSLPTILIIDDEPRSLEALARILNDDFDVKTAANVEQATALLEQEWVQVVLCDQRMPDMTGVEFLKRVRDRWPDIVRIIISGYTDTNDVVAGINEAGIYQYITKPWQPDNLILILKSAASLFRLQRENELMSLEMKMSPDRAEAVVARQRKELKQTYQFEDGIVRAADSPLSGICDKLRQVAPFDVPILLVGESGTGKELAARALHYNSLRWNKPFVVENCGALPDQLLESELFGHRRGAFTGAVENHVGLFERADGGTVFLDEIGEISPAFQVKLLRVLQNGEIRPVGGNRTRQIDVRVVAATNRDLEAEMRAGRFREDLYYRLAGVSVRMPALRERRMDIPVLAEAILQQAGTALGKPGLCFTDEALRVLADYNWPGNVRELQNEVRHMLIMAGDADRLNANLISPRILLGTPAGRFAAQGDAEDGDFITGLDGSLKDRVEALEARILRETLIRHRWNKSRAAKELGLSRVGLRSKLERYQLDRVAPFPQRGDLKAAN